MPTPAGLAELFARALDHSTLSGEKQSVAQKVSSSWILPFDSSRKKCTPADTPAVAAYPAGKPDRAVRSFCRRKAAQERNNMVTIFLQSRLRDSQSDQVQSPPVRTYSRGGHIFVPGSSRRQGTFSVLKYSAPTMSAAFESAS